MTFCLDCTIIKPEKNEDTKNVVVLLHGYGGDGKDISMLTLNWKRHLPNTIFICPNGYEPCAINPLGYQWFDLSEDDPNYILSESLKAEKKLNKFIDEIKKKYNLDNDKIKLNAYSSTPDQVDQWIKACLYAKRLCGKTNNRIIIMQCFGIINFPS